MVLVHPSQSPSRISVCMHRYVHVSICACKLACAHNCVCARAHCIAHAGLESNYDFVRVYTGNAATSSNLFRTYTGLVVPDRLLVPSNTVLIDFVSDSSATQEGFLLTAVSITSLVPTVSPITQSSTVNSGSSSIVDYVAAHNLNRTNNGLSAMVYNKNLEVCPTQ